MIDIHTHLLPLVDDGSTSEEESFAILKRYEKKGVKAVVLTPHFKGKYKTTAKEIKILFENFCRRAKASGINLKLFLGQEIHNYKDIVKDLVNGKFLTINGTKYVLFEAGRVGSNEFTEKVYRIVINGFVPIIAHVERYPSIKEKDIIEVKNMGALIQVNAGSLFTRHNRKRKRFVNRLIRQSLVDLISSDAHTSRKNYFIKAYRRVRLKFGKGEAKRLFYDNPKKILENY